MCHNCNNTLKKTIKSRTFDEPGTNTWGTNTVKSLR